MSRLYINNSRLQSQKSAKENVFPTSKVTTPLASSRSHSKSKSITYEYVII